MITFTDFTRAVSKALEKSAPKSTFYMQFFKNKQTEDTEVIELDKQFKGIKVAKFVNPDAVADGREKLSFDNYVFKLPTMQDSVSLTGKELKKRLLGENVYKQTSSAAKASILVLEIQNEQKDMVGNAMEVMAIDAVFNGKLTIIGKGENRVIDFDRSSTHEVDLGAGNYWNETGGTPEDDIEEFIDIIGQAGSNATHITGRLETIRVLVKKLAKNDDFDSKRIDRGNLTFESFADVNGAIFYGTYKGLEIWGLDGNYTDDKGVSQKAVPAKKVAILSAVNSNVDVAGYAADTDIDFPQMQGNTKAVKDNRQFISKVSQGKKVIDIEAIQTRAPMLVDADSTIVATVIS